MRVLSQKNVYYVDLNKNIYRGYVETFLRKDPSDKFVVYRSIHLEIESISIMGHQCSLSPEFFSTRSTKEKQKNTKISKNGLETIFGNSPTNPEAARSTISSDTLPSKNAGFKDQPGSSFEMTYEDHLHDCHDAFKVRIPDDIKNPELKIRIVFRPTTGNPAILWYKSVHERDKHKEVIACNFHHNSSCIAPYINSITDMEMYYVIPNTEEVKVVSSGTFKAIKEEDKTIIYHYSSFSNPKYFAFAIGTYDQCDIFSDSDRRKVLTPFSLESDVAEALNDLQAIIKYVEAFTKTTDLTTANIIFTIINVDNVVAKNMIILKYSLLGGSRDIETSFLMKRALSDCFAHQVYGLLSWSTYDAWIWQGLAGYLSDYCIRYLLGNNEFMHNYKEDKDFVVKNDVVEPPLFYTLRRDLDAFSEFFRRKAKMVFHCMEAQLSFAFLQKISDEVLDARSTSKESFGLNEIMKEDSVQDNATDLKRCFTSNFIRIVKDSTGKDLKSFFDFYVFQPGLIRVRLSFQINKKKNTVKATIVQSPTSLLPGANRRIQNSVEIKSVELEGSFDHTLCADGENVFLYHTRTKKKKKEDEEDVMPLLYIRVDPKRETLFDYTVEQPDYMRIEQLQEKNVIGQLEAVESLKEKPTINTCEALERMLDNAHVFFKVRVKIIHTLSSIKIDGYDGLQRLIQYFVRTRCVPNSTVLRGNEFGLVSYFIQKHLIKSIASINVRSADVLTNSKIVLAFLENVLKFNDNSLSQFEDSWYISSVINLFGLHSVLITSHKGTSEGYDDFSLVEQSACAEDFLMPMDYGKKISENKKSVAIIDSLEIITRCVNEIERFRVSDMVFPSNNNVVTRSCLIAYIRLAFYNKVVISRESLESLSQYPNLFSIRLVAIEGLLVLFSSSITFILNTISSDTPFMVQNTLDIILKILLLRLNVHFLDTDEFDVDLTKHVKQGLLYNLDVLLGIHRANFFNPEISELIRKIFVCLEDKAVGYPAYLDALIRKYDPTREERNRASVLKIVSASRRIRVSGLDALRVTAFEKNYTIRLPRARNVRARRKVLPKHLKVKICPRKFLVKHFGSYIIRLRRQERNTKLDERDLPLFLITKFRENPHYRQIDDYIRKTKPTHFFAWSPLNSAQILERACQRQLSFVEVYREIEKALVFVMSHNGMQTKLYTLAKSIYLSVEDAYYRNAPIPKKISPMTPSLREKCHAFLEELRKNPEYEAFVHPVDCTELKNYLDIVRIPVCFEDISKTEYGSFDAFITSMKRIAANCLNYNDSRSPIAQNARSLQKSVDDFCDSLELTYADTSDILRDTVNSANLDPNEFNISEIGSWGDLEEKLAMLERKHSLHNADSRPHCNAIKLIKHQLNSWFLNDGVRVQILEN